MHGRRRRPRRRQSWRLSSSPVASVSNPVFREHRIGRAFRKGPSGTKFVGIRFNPNFSRERKRQTYVAEVCVTDKLERLDYAGVDKAEHVFQIVIQDVSLFNLGLFSPNDFLSLPAFKASRIFKENQCQTK